MRRDLIKEDIELGNVVSLWSAEFGSGLFLLTNITKFENEKETYWLCVLDYLEKNDHPWRAKNWNSQLEVRIKEKWDGVICEIVGSSWWSGHSCVLTYIQ